MLEVLVGIALPPLIFGVFAVLAMWLGAETRPWFDERPVLDDRPNWFPIVRRVPRERDDEDALDVDERSGGTPAPEPEPVAAAVARPAPRPQPRPAIATNAATRPSGV
jgi:hypothetical protein